MEREGERRRERGGWRGGEQDRELCRAGGCMFVYILLRLFRARVVVCCLWSAVYPIHVATTGRMHTC
jgi:hypothetical protein